MELGSPATVVIMTDVELVTTAEAVVASLPSASSISKSSVNAPRVPEPSLARDDRDCPARGRTGSVGRSVASARASCQGKRTESAHARQGECKEFLSFHCSAFLSSKIRFTAIKRHAVL